MEELKDLHYYSRIYKIVNTCLKSIGYPFDSEENIERLSLHLTEIQQSEKYDLSVKEITDFVDIHY